MSNQKGSLNLELALIIMLLGLSVVFGLQWLGISVDQEFKNTQSELDQEIIDISLTDNADGTLSLTWNVTNPPYQLYFEDTLLGEYTIEAYTGDIIGGINYYKVIDSKGYWGMISVKGYPETAFVKVSCGNATTFAVDNMGRLWTWGENDCGLCGVGNFDAYSNPTIVDTGPIQDLRVAEFAALYKKNGRWYGAGQKILMPIEPPPVWDDYSNVFIDLGEWEDITSNGYEWNIGVKEDGTLWAWGRNQLTSAPFITIPDCDSTGLYQIGTDDDWAKVAMSGYISLAIKKDGTLWQIGREIFSESTDGSGNPILIESTGSPTQIGIDTWVDFRANGVGAGPIIVKNSDGSWWEWGLTSQPNPQPYLVVPMPNPPSTSDIKDIQANSFHYEYLLEDGTIWGYGGNELGQLGVGEMWSVFDDRAHDFYQYGNNAGYKTIEAAYASTVGIKEDGSLWSSGNRDWEDFNYNTTPVMFGIYRAVEQ